MNKKTEKVSKFCNFARLKLLEHVPELNMVHVGIYL